MNIKMGSQTFLNVKIPLLWGERAVLQDKEGRISIINLGSNKAFPEIVSDKPAPGIEFLPKTFGFDILNKGESLYSYDPKEKIIRSIALDLPECQISLDQISIGTNSFVGNIISGSPVGIVVKKDGIAIGGPIPEGLAELVI